jgi:GH18 family chitinase
MDHSLDFWNLMAYDYGKTSPSLTSPQSALYLFTPLAKPVHGIKYLDTKLTSTVDLSAASRP